MGSAAAGNGVMADRHWYAVWTRARHEKSVSESLERNHFEVFLPLLLSKRTWSDRRKNVQLPFFPGYTFVCTPRERLWEVSAERGVAGVLGVNGTATPVPERELQAIRTVLESSEPVDLFPGLAEGTPVTIIQGPLKGLRGTFLRWQGRFRVVIAVNLIHNGAAVHVMPEQVAPVADS